MLMSMMRLVALCAALLPLSLSMAAPFGPATVPADVTKLVPQDSMVLAYTASVEDMQQHLLKTVSAIEPQMAMLVAMSGPVSGLNMMVKKNGGPPGSAGVDSKAAAAVFMGKPDPQTGDPLVGIIFHVADSSVVESTQPSMHITRLPGSNWVSLANRPYDLPAQPSTLGEGMLSATMSANVDQKLARELFKDQIGMFLSAMQMDMPQGSMDPEQIKMMKRSQEASVQQMRMFIDGINEWNWGIDLNGSELDVLARITPADKSMLASPSSGLGGLARLIPASMPMMAVFDKSAMDQMMQQSDASMQYLPNVNAAGMKKLMELSKQAMAHCKTGYAVGMSFSDQGFRFIAVNDSDDPEASIKEAAKAIPAMNDLDLGIHATPLEFTGGGASFSLKFDVAKMMRLGMMDEMDQQTAAQRAMAMQIAEKMLGGPDGLSVHYIPVGKNVLSVIGKADAEEAKKLIMAGGADNALSKAMSNTLAPGTWGMVADIDQVVSEGLVMMRAMLGPMGAMLPPSIPNGKPVMLSMTGSSAGKGWDQIRVRTDLKDWYDMFQNMQKAMQPPAAASGGAGGSRR